MKKILTLAIILFSVSTLKSQEKMRFGVQNTSFMFFPFEKTKPDLLFLLPGLTFEKDRNRFTVAFAPRSEPFKTLNNDYSIRDWTLLGDLKTKISQYLFVGVSGMYSKATFTESISQKSDYEFFWFTKSKITLSANLGLRLYQLRHFYLDIYTGIGARAYASLASTSRITMQTGYSAGISVAGIF